MGSGLRQGYVQTLALPTYQPLALDGEDDDEDDSIYDDLVQHIQQTSMYVFIKQHVISFNFHSNPMNLLYSISIF